MCLAGSRAEYDLIVKKKVYSVCTVVAGKYNGIEKIAPCI